MINDSTNQYFFMEHTEYVKLLNDSLCQLARKILEKINNEGLGAKQQLFITFLSRAPGVQMPSDLLQKYPKEMTIVIQHQFSNLKVTKGSFSVDLVFDGATKNIKLPFSAIKNFSDPSANFNIHMYPPYKKVLEAEKKDKLLKESNVQNDTSLSLEAFRAKKLKAKNQH